MSSTTFIKMGCFLFLLFPLIVYGQSTIKPEHKTALLKNTNLQLNDLDELHISSTHTSALSGIYHVYFQQYYQGIPINQGVGSIHEDANGNLIQVNNSLLRASLATNKSTLPKLSANQVINKAKGFLQSQLKSHPQNSIKNGEKNEEIFSAENPNDLPILTFEPVGKNELKLCWRLSLKTEHDTHQVLVDAENGNILKYRPITLHCDFAEKENEETSNFLSSSKDLKSHLSSTTNHTKCAKHSPQETPTSILKFPNSQSSTTSFDGQYNIFPLSVESPIYGSRSLKTGLELIDATAAPYGWHDTDGDAATIEFDYTRGNHVYAFYAPTGTVPEPIATKITRDAISNNYVFGNVPIPANNSLNFNYTNDIAANVATSFLEDAVTNLFTINNLCHDVFYHYGFDESAGNFQTTNHTGNGMGNDEVLARVQDGDGLNRASFTPAVEGTKPTMKMSLWTSNLPSQVDGDFDNLVAIHEYGHGVSLRLVGGANNINCLSNFEQGGEGWSDFFGLMLTMKDHNNNGMIDEYLLGEGVRGVGNYLLGNAPNESGFRPRHYTYNMEEASVNFNEFTYEDVNSLAFPHGVGFLWCTMLWDMTLKLMEVHGFSSDIYDETSTAGNIRALNIVVEALKMTPCEPSFVDMRNAVLDANTALYAGANQDILWEVFARRGLGFGAAAGGNASFVTPTISVTKTVDKQEANIGETVNYSISVQNNTNASINNVVITDNLPTELSVNGISDNGSISNGIITWPSVATLASGSQVTRTFSGTINATAGTSTLFAEPVETATPSNFIIGGAWLTDQGNPNPNTGSTRSWWHLDPFAASESSLILNLNLDANLNNHLSFWQYYNLEPTLDGGVIEILEGGAWVDLKNKIIDNSYNSFIFDVLATPIGVPVPVSTLSGRRAYSGYSGGYVQTIIDLSTYSGTVQIRFRFASNDSNVTANCHNNNCEGWFLDDFKLYDLQHILNEAAATSSNGFSSTGNVGKVGTIYFGGILPVELLDFWAIPKRDEIELNWQTTEEFQNAGFYLQRRSETENTFENIAFIENAKINHDLNDYQYVDTEVEKNLQYYYRLQQIDLDGTAEFSKIITATIYQTKENLFSLFPNPATDILTIQWEKNLTVPQSVEIFNLEGKILRSYQINEEVSSFSIPIKELPASIYLIKMSNSVETSFQSFIKE